MCGIFCLLSSLDDAQILDLYKKSFEKNIKRRGPNCYNFTVQQSCASGFRLLISASILWLQGQEITAQPVENEHYIFIYNGDVFGGTICNHARRASGDTKLLFEQLASSQNISNTLENIQGPYAFILYEKKQNLLYFGRDIYGRRSLLLGKKGEDVIVTSVARRNTSFDFIELPSIGTFCYDLSMRNWTIFPWRRKNSNFQKKCKELDQFLGCRINVIQNDVNSIRELHDADSIDLESISTIKKIENPIECLLKNTKWLENVQELERLLENSVKKRIETQPGFCRNCYGSQDCSHCSVGVLFSGGVDCAILAYFSDKTVPKNQPIDLINVSFATDTPDRKTGLQTLQELRLLCPQREWNFVQVNVSTEELNELRSSHIADLIYPLNTVLDDSLGCALWFAARARSLDYESSCRIVIVGMGADELFGGYSRHRIAYKNASWDGLQRVLDEDWENISFRNLARDDRVVSDHGRQLRTPYLDEDIVDFARNLKPWEKTLPLQEITQGIGEKILLRTLAAKVGLGGAARLKKRALQFGSRIANRKENGHEISQRLSQ